MTLGVDGYLLNVEDLVGEGDCGSVGDRVEPAGGDVLAQLLLVQVGQFALLERHDQVVVVLHGEGLEVLRQREQILSDLGYVLLWRECKQRHGLLLLARRLVLRPELEK